METLSTGGLPLKFFVAKIPKNYMLFFGKILGSLIYFLAVPQRRIVRRNLQFSHFASSPKQIQIMAKRIFQNFGITILELLQMTCFSQKELLANLQVENKGILLEALARKRGVVLITAHMGNYEMAWQYVPCYFGRQMVGVAKKMRNVWFDRLLHHIRTRFGNRIIYKKGALPEMMRTLRRGEIVGILMDISRRFDGVEVNFMGRRATATPAAALLGLRCKSPIIPAFCHRSGNGKLIVHIERPIDIQRTKNLRFDLQTNTQLITDRVERAVRSYPEQWNWMLRRWKEFYPTLYPETAKRLRKIKEKGKKGEKRKVT